MSATTRKPRERVSAGGCVVRTDEYGVAEDKAATAAIAPVLAGLFLGLLAASVLWAYCAMRGWL